MQSHYGLKNINNVIENIYKGHCLIAKIIFLKFFHNHSFGRNIQDYSLLKSKYLNVAKIILLANFAKNHLLKIKSKFEDPKQKDSLLNDISCPIKISGLIKHVRSKKDDLIQFFLEESNKDTPIANFLIAIDLEVVKLVFSNFGLSHSRLCNSRIIEKSNVKELTNFCF